MSDSIEILKEIDDLLSLPHQIWLFGAGISCESGIPLMYPLTNRVEQILKDDYRKDYQTIRSMLPKDSHVEHILSHIGDLISIAARLESQKTSLGKEIRTVDELRNFHSEIQKAIRDIVRWGYFPPGDNIKEKIGTRKKPIVTIDEHKSFVNALFQTRRRGLERRPAVDFFTTNYDTLLEDALSLNRIPIVDGFSGGSMAFWDPGVFSHNTDVQAAVHKLHGSIDWYVSDEDIVVRRREGAGYPPEASGRLLIYPQATKYQLTQKDPFATLFNVFRSKITQPEQALLAICGYSFGDDHINEEIEQALMQRSNDLTILAFIKQKEDEIEGPHQGFPRVIAKWLAPESAHWNQRVVVAGSRGIYRGSFENLYPARSDHPHLLWTFDGVTQLLKNGPEVEK